MAQDASILRHYLAPLQRCLEPEDVTELVVNRPGELAIERPGGWEWREAPELTETWLATLAKAAAAYTSQDVTDETPICSTVLPQGERCQVVLPPAAERLSITVR
jgi:type IV secretion system protein VirB11